MRLRLLGFCGVDDSVDPRRMLALSRSNPFVEWGVLFHPGREGTPRYASSAWVDRMLVARRSSPTGAGMRLAAHLCGPAINQVLHGDVSFVKQLAAKGFGRVQLNATAVNGAEISDAKHVGALVRKALPRVPEVEWILQRNEETLPLWGPIIADPPPGATISTLFDASAGLGIAPEGLVFPPVDPRTRCGFAGGIGVDNIHAVLTNLQKQTTEGETLWVDMETSLRRQVSEQEQGQQGQDVFAMERAEKCAEIVTAMGFPSDGGSSGHGQGSHGAASL